jgi:hypothetical protein
MECPKEKCRRGEFRLSPCDDIARVKLTTRLMFDLSFSLIDNR